MPSKGTHVEMQTKKASMQAEQVKESGFKYETHLDTLLLQGGCLNVEREGQIADNYLDNAREASSLWLNGWKKKKRKG